MTFYICSEENNKVISQSVSYLPNNKYPSKDHSLSTEDLSDEKPKDTLNNKTKNPKDPTKKNMSEGELMFFKISLLIGALFFGGWFVKWIYDKSMEYQKNKENEEYRKITDEQNKQEYEKWQPKIQSHIEEKIKQKKQQHNFINDHLKTVLQFDLLEMKNNNDNDTKQYYDISSHFISDIINKNFDIKTTKNNDIKLTINNIDNEFEYKELKLTEFFNSINSKNSKKYFFYVMMCNFLIKMDSALHYDENKDVVYKAQFEITFDNKYIDHYIYFLANVENYLHLPVSNDDISFKKLLNSVVELTKNNIR